MRARRFRPFRLGLWLGVLGAAVWLVARQQRRAREAAMPRAAPGADGWRPVEAAPRVVPPPTVEPAAGPAPTAPRKAAAKKKAVAKKQAPARIPAAWVAPDAGGICPSSHPVKAKLSSKLFHLPGMLAYDRTNPDRCYRDEAAAEADGLRKAKR